MSERATELRERQVAEILDDVDWAFDPEADAPSPLVSTERYFRDFPWQGNPDDDDRGLED